MPPFNCLLCRLARTSVTASRVLVRGCHPCGVLHLFILFIYRECGDSINSSGNLKKLYAFTVPARTQSYLWQSNHGDPYSLCVSALLGHGCTLSRRRRIHPNSEVSDIAYYSGQCASGLRYTPLSSLSSSPSKGNTTSVRLQLQPTLGAKNSHTHTHLRAFQSILCVPYLHCWVLHPKPAKTDPPGQRRNMHHTNGAAPRVSTHDCVALDCTHQLAVAACPPHHSARGNRATVRGRHTPSTVRLPA